MSPARGRTNRWDAFPPASKPRAVDGGLVARSGRGQIGEQWWSRRFVEVLESFALGSRLTRGKSYARRGQVLSLEVTPGTVTARVQGSRRAPYKVSIGLPTFPELVWAKVEVQLAEQAGHTARLLAGELPGDLEPVFTAAGAPLFPRRAADLGMSCSCPDWEVPCKHLSATFYLLAESFDDDPFRILHWRGRSREALLGRLRQLRDGDSSGPTVGTPAAVDNAAEAPLVGAAAALAEFVPVPAATLFEADPARFWTGEPPAALPVHSPLPADLLLRQLAVPPAILGGAGLLDTLRPMYAVLAERGGASTE